MSRRLRSPLSGGVAVGVALLMLAAAIGFTAWRRQADSEIRLASLRGRIVFSQPDRLDEERDILTARPDGTDVRRLTRGGGPEDDPTWSPDGTRIAYRDSRRGYNQNDEIFVMSSNGSKRRNLTKSVLNEWGPAWSPDGSLIAFNRTSQLYVMRPDGGGMRRISDVQGEYPAWSPDSRRIAFMSPSTETGSVRDPNYDVFVVNVDGSELRRLTTWRGQDGWPDWSPDGERIVFTTSRNDRGQFLGGRQIHLSVYVMNADGSEQRRLVDTWSAFPDWSPDGRFILFVRSTLTRWREQLAVVRPDGSGLRWLPIRGGLPDWLDES